MDETTHREIEKTMWHTLRDADIVRPPVEIETILQYLHPHRDFYNLRNPGFLDRTKHKIGIYGNKLADIFQKINLKAVLFYDEDRIVIDAELPQIRQDWPSFHESAHKILPCPATGSNRLFSSSSVILNILQTTRSLTVAALNPAINCGAKFVNRNIGNSLCRLHG